MCSIVYCLELFLLILEYIRDVRGWNDNKLIKRHSSSIQSEYMFHMSIFFLVNNLHSCLTLCHRLQSNYRLSNLQITLSHKHWILILLLSRELAEDILLLVTVIFDPSVVLNIKLKNIK